MDDIRQTAINRFRAYLERRQFSAHTLASYTLDLHVFFRTVTVPLAQVSFREVDHFVEDQHQQGPAWATINRRLNALKHFFDFCLDQQWVVGNPVKPSHFVRRGRPLPKALSREQVQRLFAQIAIRWTAPCFWSRSAVGCPPRRSHSSSWSRSIGNSRPCAGCRPKGARIGGC